jgi:hypothetical protein
VLAQEKLDEVRVTLEHVPQQSPWRHAQQIGSSK